MIYGLDAQSKKDKQSLCKQPLCGLLAFEIQWGKKMLDWTMMIVL